MNIKSTVGITPVDSSRRLFVKQALGAGLAAHLVGIGQVAKASTPVHSVCDSSDILSGAEKRRRQAYKIREQAALAQMHRPLPPHPNNGDEALYPNRIGSFSKGLPHNALGEVDPAAYQTYLCALAGGSPEDFARIPLGDEEPGHAVFDNPQAGLAFDLEGADSHALAIPPAPRVGSAEETGEILELYWMALTRDVAFRDYNSNPIAQAAADDLSTLSDFRGPKSGGRVTTNTLFRDPLPGCEAGPYGSQFRWLPIPYGATAIDPQIITAVPNINFLTDATEWLRIQNGALPRSVQQYDDTPRYIRNGRDAGQFVHVDILHQAYYQAMLILLAFNCSLNPGNPYRTSSNQRGFSTFGVPHLETLLPEVGTRALHAQWFQKWFVHRRLRPEAYGGLIHQNLVSNTNYPVWTQELSRSTVWTYLAQQYPGSYFLPQAFPEGSPIHPSYGSGHAAVAGACITILKAWFDGSQTIAHLLEPYGLQPVVSTADGLALEAYTGPDAEELTVAGELNKLASNVAASRNFAGVHWRSDAVESLKLGEAVAICVLEDQRATYNEHFNGFTFRKFDGTEITV